MLDLEAIRAAYEYGDASASDIPGLIDEVDMLRATLGTILDNVDYTTGNCRQNEQVGAVLPIPLIVRAREVLR